MTSLSIRSIDFKDLSTKISIQFGNICSVDKFIDNFNQFTNKSRFLPTGDENSLSDEV